MTEQNRSRVGSLAVGLVICALTGIQARAGVLNADGNFAAETDGAQVGADWAPHGWYAGGAAASQSPFTNLFSNNGMGVQMAGGGYMVGMTPSLITTGLLNLNVDFRYDTIDTPWPNARFAFDVTRDAGGVFRALSISVAAAGVYAEGDGGMGASLFTPVLATWYNVQLTLDVGASTYSGTITPYGGTSVVISPRGFVTQSGINGVYTNNEQPGGGQPAGCPAYSVDNFALSTVPEPATLGLLAFGGLVLVRRRQR